MPIRDFKPLVHNPNKHTEIGTKALEASMRMNGYVAPMTAAADGTILDGNARLEVAEDILQTDPLVIESDGTRPIIVKRTDIPNADTILAKRIILSANRVQELDYLADDQVLTSMLQELNMDGNLSGSGYTDKDIKGIMETVDNNSVAENDTGIKCPNCGYYIGGENE
jgi:hypothetical protein